MARRKKQNKNWIYVVLIVLALVIFSNYQPVDDSPVQITATYYDANGNVIGTSGRGLTLQAFVSPGLEEVPAEAAFMSFAVKLTNIGNIDSVASVDAINVDGDPISADPSPTSINIAVGEIGSFDTGLLDISSYNGEHYIGVDFSATGLDEFLEDEYRWRFFKEFPFCYQESAIVPDQTGRDGDCGLEYTGSYVTDTRYWFYINYTKPLGSINSAIWSVKHSSSNSYAVDVPSSCLDYDATTLSLRFRSETGQESYGQCYDGTWNTITSVEVGGSTGFRLPTNQQANLYDGDWDTYATDGYSSYRWNKLPKAGRIYEEAIIWEVLPPPAVCYQESATVSDQTGIDGECSLDYTGERSEYMFLDTAKSDDGDWDTYGEGTMGGALSFTYKKPTDATSATIRVKIGDLGINDLPVHQDCWDYQSDSIIFAIFSDNQLSGQSYVSCRYGFANWHQLIADTDDNEVYEAAMTWHINDYLVGSNVIIDGNTYNLLYQSDALTHGFSITSDSYIEDTTITTPHSDIISSEILRSTLIQNTRMEDCVIWDSTMAGSTCHGSTLK